MLDLRRIKIHILTSADGERKMVPDVSAVRKEGEAMAIDARVVAEVGRTITT